MFRVEDSANSASLQYPGGLFEVPFPSRRSEVEVPPPSLRSKFEAPFPSLRPEFEFPSLRSEFEGPAPRSKLPAYGEWSASGDDSFDLGFEVWPRLLNHTAGSGFEVSTHRVAGPQNPVA